ncbi:MAG: hypothetical protein ACK4UJ_06625 [Leptonema sp. (in: bacteria)]
MNFIIFLLILFMLLPKISFSESLPKKFKDEILTIGDMYYQKRQYDQSIIFYEIAKQTLDFESELYSKLLLNYIRLKEKNYKIQEAHLKELIELNSEDFLYNYISLYGSFRFGYYPIAFSKIYKIQNSHIEPTKKEYAKLVFGSIYFEENHNLAKIYYQNLYKESTTEEVKTITKEILQEIEDFDKNFTLKKPILAGILSGILPGAGYFYTNHYMDGIFSFFWNVIFLGGGLYMYSLEKESQKPHIVSSAFLLVGIGIYLANITGSYTSAIRYNNYKIRIFYQQLRNLYFNTDFIEKTSGIEFRIKF